MRANKLLTVLLVFVVLCVVIAVSIFFLRPTLFRGAKSDISPYGDEKITLTQADRDALVAAARGFLTNAGDKVEGLSADLAKPYNKEVFVTLFTPEKDYLRGVARGKTVIDSLERACADLRKNPKFTTSFADKMGQTRIAIHIINKVKSLDSKSVSKIAAKVEPGIHGLMMDSDKNRYFQLGEDVLFNDWGMKGFGDRDRVYGKKMAEFCLRQLAKEADLEKDGWQDKKLHYFSVHPMVEITPGGKALETYRAAKLWPKTMSRSLLLESAWLAAGQLARNTGPDGKLDYHYQPVWDKSAKERDYNIVRHAGAVWGMFVAYKATGDKELLDAGLRSWKYLDGNIKYAKEDPNVGYLDYNGKSMLGTNALAAMVLVDMPVEMITPEWKDKRDKLGNGLIAFHLPDGSFYTYWDEVLKKTPPKQQARYFPGEAFLSFMLLYELDKNPKWLQHAKLCAKWQMDDYDRDSNQQPDAWVVQALSKLYLVTKDERIPKSVFKMVEWHFRHQWGMPEKGKSMPYEDYFGGADNATPPRSTPTSARNEANVEAWHLAKLLGNQEMVKKLGESCMAAYWQNLVDQFWPETSYYAKKPDKVLGGIRGALIANDIRIDYNQHYLNAVINGLDIAEEFNGVGDFSPLAKGKILDVYKLKIKPADAAKQLAGGK